MARGRGRGVVKESKIKSDGAGSILFFGLRSKGASKNLLKQKIACLINQSLYYLYMFCVLFFLVAYNLFRYEKPKWFKLLYFELVLHIYLVTSKILTYLLRKFDRVNNKEIYLNYPYVFLYMAIN